MSHSRKYLREWLRTSQTEVFLSNLARSMEDPRAIAELWEDNGHAIGFLWVTFHEITDYSITVAEVNDLEVSPERPGHRNVDMEEYPMFDVWLRAKQYFDRVRPYPE